MVEKSSRAYICTRKAILNMQSKPSKARALAFVERTKAEVLSSVQANQATRVLSLPLPPVLVHLVHRTGAPFFSSAHRSQKILPD